MAIDTEEKRYASLTFGHCLNAGTRIPSGTSTAARRGAALALYYIEGGTAVENVTTRLTLIGTSRKRLSINGTSRERMTISGTSSKRLTIEGSSR